jgi:hypothetical protein
MERITIPRGLKIRETVAYGLNGKQIIYLAFGIGGAVGICTLPLPIDLKMAGSILSAIASLALSLAKRHGQELDKYALECIKYPLRQKEWSNVDESPKEITINFRAKQPHTT